MRGFVLGGTNFQKRREHVLQFAIFYCEISFTLANYLILSVYVTSQTCFWSLLKTVVHLNFKIFLIMAPLAGIIFFSCYLISWIIHFFLTTVVGMIWGVTTCIVRAIIFLIMEEVLVILTFSYSKLAWIEVQLFYNYSSYYS